MATRKHRYKKNHRNTINTRRKKSKGKGFTARNYTKKSVEISNLPIDKDIQKEILKNMKREDAATLIQSVHRKNHPRGYNVKLYITPTLASTFRENRDSIEVFKQWFATRILDVRYQAIIDSENVEIENNNSLKLSFRVNDPRIFELEITIESVLSLDDDGNYPIYIDRQKNIHLDKPSGTSKASLVYVKENRGRIITPYY